MQIKECNLIINNNKPEIKIVKQYNYLNTINLSTKGLKNLAHFFNKKIGNNYFESFYIVFFNSNGDLLFIYNNSVGNHDETIIYYDLIEIIIQLNKNISYMVLVHNHPNGILYFSEDDNNFMIDITDLGEKYSIIVVDSLIVSKNNYIYCSEEGEWLL